MKKIHTILLNQNATIHEALNIIDQGAMKLGVIIDHDNRLIGTISDGDIRRGLLNGMTLESSISSIIHKNPISCKSSDTKETIIQLALAKKVYQIPVIDNNGRIVDIYDINDLISSVPKTNSVILMAGGLGSRLGELTKNTPKPMLNVGGKPILETIIENFARYGFTNIIISVNYLSHVIEKYFGDGSRFGVTIEYIHEQKRLGTAGAISLIRDKLREPFFVMNGDLLTNINFENLYNYHMSNQSIATMCVREYDFQVPYGVVNINNDTILSIEEKPIHKFFVSAGIYMLSPETLTFIPDDEFFDMPSLFDQLIKANYKTNSFALHEYWLDIGRLNDFEQANSEFQRVFNA